MGGGTVGQRGDLVRRARRPQAASSSAATAPGSSRATWAAARWASAVTWSAAPASRRLPAAGHGVRVVEGGVGGGIAGAAAR